MSITLTWGWPQIIMVVLLFTGLVINCAKHGQPVDMKWNAFGRAFTTIWFSALLWWGGFF